MNNRPVTALVLLVMATLVTAALADTVLFAVEPLMPWFAWMLP
jgi:hypothetical protein